jgi:hypothetical protein
MTSSLIFYQQIIKHLKTKSVLIIIFTCALTLLLTSTIFAYENSLKEVKAHSSELISWAIMLIGGSIASIIGTSYYRPNKIRYRLCYLLMIPGWLCLLRSIYYGRKISGGYLASIIGKNNNLQQIRININSDFTAQLDFLNAGIYCLSAWLFIYMILWIFTDQMAVKIQNPPAAS